MPRSSLLSLAPLALAAAALLSVGCCSAELEDLRAEHADDRRRALACLAEQTVEDPALVQPLARAAAALVDPDREGDPSVRATAIRVLRFLEAGVAPVSSALVAEPDPAVRGEAVVLVARVGKADQVLPALRRLLREDPEASVRYTCARELLVLADRSPETTDALVDSLADPALTVRQNARRTLCKLLETDQGDDPRGWKKWLDARREAPAVALPEPGGPPPPSRPVEGEGGAPRPEDYAEPEPEGAAPSPQDYEFPQEEAFPDPARDAPRAPEAPAPAADPPAEGPAPPPETPAPEAPAPAPEAPAPAPEAPAPAPEAPAPSPPAGSTPR